MSDRPLKTESQQNIAPMSTLDNESQNKAENVNPLLGKKEVKVKEATVSYGVFEIMNYD